MSGSRSALASTVVVGLVIGFAAALVVVRPRSPRAGPVEPHAPPAAAPAPSSASPEATLPPDAARSSALFERNRTMASDPDLAGEYDAINDQFFANILPAPQVRWESGLGDLGPMIAENFVVQGLTDGRMILLNPSVEHDGDQRRRALCHEMVHMAVWKQDSGHGPVFQERLSELAQRGAFKGVVATDEEKDATLAALKREHGELETEEHALTVDRASLDRTSQAAVDAYNARVTRQREAVAAYNRLIERYNLMVSYPDGLARERLALRADGTSR